MVRVNDSVTCSDTRIRKAKMASGGRVLVFSSSRTTQARRTEDCTREVRTRVVTGVNSSRRMGINEPRDNNKKRTRIVVSGRECMQMIGKQVSEYYE